MKKSSRSIFVLIGIGIVLSIMACSVSSVFNKASEGGSTINGNDGTNKSGDVLPDPSFGLATLAGYKAVLEQEVSGTLDGQAIYSSTQVEITRINSTGDYDFISVVGGSEIAGYQLRLLAQGDAFYRWMQSAEACIGGINPPNEGEVFEPASLLLPISNATRMGKETVNGIASEHYRFDQEGLYIEKDGSNVAGDVWLSEEGGYLVKYVLTSPLPDKLSGKGLETSQTWTYELSLVNAAEGISLPTNCMPVPTDIPVTSDARDVRLNTGALAFTSNLKPIEVADFYVKELPALGWTLPEHLPEGDISLPNMVTFTKADQVLTLVLTESEEGGMDVDLEITPIIGTNAVSSEGAEELPSGTPTIAPTINPAESGLPDDIPLYPGATELFKMSQLVMFKAPDDPGVVVAYYKEQMLANGWSLTMETSQDDVSMQMWDKPKGQVTLIVSVQEGRTQVNISMP